MGGSHKASASTYHTCRIHLSIMYLSIYLSIHPYIHIYPSVYGSDFLRPNPMPGTVKEHSVYRMNERMNLWVKLGKDIQYD